jgi:type I restriction enzyme S subunit
MREQTLKPGWTWVKFGDVVRLNTDRCADPAAEGIERYVGLEHIEPEDLRIRRWGLVADGTTFTNRFKPGQVLFGKRRAYQRKVAVADFEGICSSDIYVFEPKDEYLLAELLPFLCQTEGFFEYAVGTSAGSLSPRTNWTQLANYEFALPRLEEQRRYFNALFQTENLLESLSTLADAIGIMADSLIEQVLSPLISNRQFPLAEHSDVCYGLTVNETRRNAPNRIPYLRVANVQRSQLDLTEVKDIGFINGDEEYLLKKYDVLIVEGHANTQEVGRAVFCDSQIDRCSHQNHLIRVRCGSELDPEFLVTYLNSTFGRRYFLKHAKSTSGLNTINSRVVREVPIPEMSLEQQRNLVGIVNQISLQTDAANTRYAATKQLKSLLLMELSQT